MTKLVAHRGASDQAPENTRAAVELAWRQGAQFVETDIRLTHDGRVVVMHDATAKRTTGLDRPVCELTFDELRALDAGALKGPQWAGERVPTLEELLATIPSAGRLLVEIKSGLEIMEPLQRVMVQSALAPERVAFLGFDAQVVGRAKRLMPERQAAWLCMVEKRGLDGPVRFSVEQLIETAQAAGMDGLAVGSHERIDESFVAAVHSAGLWLNVWTVDELEAARRYVGLGIDLLTTNRLAWMREQLGQ